MATRAQIRAALKVRLDTIAGWQGAYAVVPDSAAVPCYAIGPPARGTVRTADITIGGGSLWWFGIRVYVARGDLRSAQETLDPYLDESGAQSVQAAIYGDQRLGGLVNWTRIQEVRDEGVYVIADTSYYGAEILVSVSA